MDAVLYTAHPLVDAIVIEHAAHARGDAAGWAAYRNHALRTLSYAVALAPGDRDHVDRLAIAAAFHDLDVFSTLDCLGPSMAAAAAWLQRTDRAAWTDEVLRTIAFHHRPLPYRGPHARSVEALRRADWNEILLGTVSFGVPRELMRRARRALPIGPFLTRTIPRAGLRWAVRHPRPVPPNFRGRRALQGRSDGRG